MLIKPIDAGRAIPLTNDGQGRLPSRTYLFEQHRQAALNAHSSVDKSLQSLLVCAHDKEGWSPKERERDFLVHKP